MFCFPTLFLFLFYLIVFYSILRTIEQNFANVLTIFLNFLRIVECRINHVFSEAPKKFRLLSILIFVYFCSSLRQNSIYDVEPLFLFGKRMENRKKKHLFLLKVRFYFWKTNTRIVWCDFIRLLGHLWKIKILDLE